MPRKTERGDPLGFSNIHSVAKQQNVQGGPFGEKNFPEKKSRSAEKKGKWGPFGMVRYAEKQEKPFWFSSLGQMVPFGAIIFCRTLKNYFGQFVWIEKKRKATIIVAFHFMKRRLKIAKITYTKQKRNQSHGLSHLMTLKHKAFQINSTKENL